RAQLAAQAEESRRALADLEKVKRERMAIASAKERAETEKLLLGRGFEVPVRQQGRVVGTVRAQVRGRELLRRVLARTRGEGEIPFALDAEGKLHTINDEDRRSLEKLQLPLAGIRAGKAARWVIGDWVVATSNDPESGLVLGLARPVPLAEVRRTAARNFGYGLGMIGLALLGILPLSTHMTRNLKLVTEGADRIAHGDLDARVPVRSKSEFGKLALAFNGMAADLKSHQERLLEEERLRQEREIEQALLRTEYERKTLELEEARRFQLSLLPKTLPAHPAPARSSTRRRGRSSAWSSAAWRWASASRGSPAARSPSPRPACRPSSSNTGRAARPRRSRSRACRSAVLPPSTRSGAWRSPPAIRSC